MKNKRILFTFCSVVLIVLFLGFFYYFNNVKSLGASAKEFCEDCNVILVTMDTTRADHFSSYGYDRDTTTLLDALSAKGVTFENNFVQMPYTPTSHWSIMSGLYPHTHNHFSPGVPVDNGGPNDTELPFLAKVLNENGYATQALMGSMMVHSLVPGFDIVDITPAVGRDNTAKPVTEKALKWIKNNKDRKFFTWIHYWDPHDPYLPPEEYIYEDDPEEEFDKFEYMQRHYDGEIKHVDHQFGRVLELLEDLEIDEKTIVVITSDHGESFGERARGDFAPEMPNSLARGHYQTVYDEELHVPLIIYNPANPHAGERFDILSQSIDIMPTILNILNIDVPYEVDGRSLKDVVDGAVDKVNDYTFSILKYVPNELMEMKNGPDGKNNGVEDGGGKWQRGLRATIRTDKWKLIRFTNTQSDEEIISYALYDLEGAGEGKDVSNEHLDVYQQMIEQLELMIEGGGITDGVVDLTDEEINILKSLGYIK